MTALAFLHRLDHLLEKILRKMTLGNFIALFLLLPAVVFVRFVPFTSLGWSDEIIEWCFAWMIFLGSAALWRKNEHFRVNWLPARLEGKRAGKYLAMLGEILFIFFLGVMTYYGIWLMIAAHDRSPILELPRHVWYLCIQLAGVIMIAYSIRNLVGYWKKE